VAPDMVPNRNSLKKNDVIAKVLISSQLQSVCNKVPQKSKTEIMDFDSSSSNFEDDCLEEDN